MAHVFITGGAGFIGSHLAEYHLAKGDQVHVVDNLSTGSLDNISSFQDNPAFRFDNADILTWSGLEKAVVWADRVYHLAAVVGMYKVLAEPIKVVATNIAGCERVLRFVALGGWKSKVILASSSEVYGQSQKPSLSEQDNLIIEARACGRCTYAISKLADEALGLAYNHKAKMPIVIVRFFNTIGPRQSGRYGMVVPRFVQEACEGEPITIFGDGTQTRCFCDVRDTVSALDVLAENSKSNGQIVNVGLDHEISIKNLAELVRARAKSDSKISYISYREAYDEDYVDIMRRRPALEQFYELTNFKHKWTLEKTIDDLIARFREGYDDIPFD